MNTNREDEDNVNIGRELQRENTPLQKKFNNVLDMFLSERILGFLLELFK